MDPSPQSAHSWCRSVYSWQVIQERARVTKELEALGWEVIPSSSNFVLATVPASFNGGAANVYAELKAQEILVRYVLVSRQWEHFSCGICGAPVARRKRSQCRIPHVPLMRAELSWQ